MARLKPLRSWDYFCSRGVKPRGRHCSAQELPHSTPIGERIKSGQNGPLGHGFRMSINVRTRVASLVILTFAVLPARAESDSSPSGPQLAHFVRSAQWRSVEAGIQQLVGNDQHELGLHAFRFQRTAIRAGIALQLQSGGSSAVDIAKAKNALAVANAGYFEYGAHGALVPTGQLVVDGRKISRRQNCRACSGLLYVGDDGELQLDWVQNVDAARKLASAVQVGPLLVEPGGVMGVTTRGNAASRIAVCLDPQAISIVLTAKPVTLYDFAWLLQRPIDQGGFGCERAINLDGGPSAQLQLRLKDGDIRVGLPTLVQNFLVLYRK